MSGVEMEHDAIKFSLILATVGRNEELARFLQHLDQQTYRNFELIIIDQNSNGILDSLIDLYQGRFPLLHLRSECGLSRARNVGLQHFSGDVVAFPDDDCWYAPDTLEKIALILQENPKCDGLTGRAVDDSRPGAFSWFPKKNGWVNKKNVWRRSVSITIFLREGVSRAVGLFDESLGVGSPNGKLSGEETDYLIRGIESGFRIHYRADLCIFHPDPVPTYDSLLIKKSYGYSLGCGYVLKKHNYPVFFVFNYLLRVLGGAVVSMLSLNFSKCRYNFAVLKGCVLGWLG
jgi:glycosyltransferase involved in cell wall biosynthesis